MLGALGEGQQGKYDQHPLYRTDAFDCVTYVSTVIALAKADNLSTFKKEILKIRYQNANPAFTHRNHFMTVDWNKNNAANGYVRDITYKFTDKNGKPVAKVANAIIDKPRWYQTFKLNSLQLLNNLPSDRALHLLSNLQNESKKMQQERGVILYLPLDKLYNSKGVREQTIFDQIPSGAIIEIVRPNWQLQDKIGTNLNVSHLGFAIRTKEGLMYREASSQYHKIVDIKLSDYLKKYLTSETVKGISILEVINKKTINVR